MSKLKSLEELRQIRQRAEQNTRLRAAGENPDIVITVGLATCGIAAGAREIMSVLLNEAGSFDRVTVTATGCLGFCYAEPLVEVRIPGQEPVRYRNVDADTAREIMRKHIGQGELVEHALFHPVGGRPV